MTAVSETSLNGIHIQGLLTGTKGVEKAGDWRVKRTLSVGELLKTKDAVCSELETPREDF